MGKTISSYLRAKARQTMSRLPDEIKFPIYRSQLHLDYNPSPDLTCRLAQTREDLESAFEILHDSYVRSGFMKPHPSGLRVTKYHALASTSTLVLCLKDKVVATISLIRDNPFGLPMDSAFDLSDLRKNGRRLVEVSSLAVHKDYRGNHGAILWPLLKYMHQYATFYFGADCFVIAVNPKRVDYFKGILLFSHIDNQAVSDYGFVNGAPAEGLFLPLGDVRNRYFSHYGLKSREKNLAKYMVSAKEGGVDFNNFELPDRSINRVSDPVMTPELLNYFFNKRTNVFSQLTKSERLLLQQNYLGLPHQAILPPVDPKENPLSPRQQKRHDVFCQAELTLNNGQCLSASVLEVGETGLRLRVDSKIHLAPDQTLNLRIATGHFDVSQVEARVRWSAQDGVFGLEAAHTDLAWSRFIRSLNLDYKGLQRVPIGKKNVKHSA